MPRDPSGVYSLPVGNPVVTGTIIESGWANTTMNDISAALTDSLSRTGNGGMLVPFFTADGSAGNPSYSFTNGPTSGMYWDNGGDEVVISVNAGTALYRFTKTGMIYNGSLDVNGDISGNQVTATGKFLAGAGSLTTPSYTFNVEQTSGVSYDAVADEYNISILGLKVTSVGSGGLVVTGDMTASGIGTFNSLVVTTTAQIGGDTNVDGTFSVGTDKFIVDPATGDTAIAGTLTVQGTPIADAIYPVGSIYMNANNATNPATLLGFGTWVAFGAGKVPVGFDSGDTDFDTPEETGGAKTHTLTEAELPSHKHYLAKDNGYVTGTQLTGDNSMGVVAYNQGHDYLDYMLAQNQAGPALEPDTGLTGGTGDGQPHNNLQPYITVYMWKRTA